MSFPKGWSPCSLPISCWIWARRAWCFGEGDRRRALKDLISSAGSLNMTSAVLRAVGGRTRPRGINLLVRLSRQN